jgi:D-erythro-7,8-dihydroneopterin triphosphate epimerase
MIIEIKNLKTKTFLGIHDWEKSFLREIIINAEIETNHIQSLFSDEIKDTIDYDSLTKSIKEFIDKNHFNLIEKLTHQIIQLIMKDHRITRCKVRIDKMNVIENVESFAVTLEEKRVL